MKIEYSEQENTQTISHVCGADEKTFGHYIKSKEAYLEKRDEAAIKRLMGSAMWQMGKVA